MAPKCKSVTRMATSSFCQSEGNRVCPWIRKFLSLGRFESNLEDLWYGSDICAKAFHSTAESVAN